MVTVFQSRKLVRDELVALFVADGSWSEVWGYFPGVNAFGARTPLLTVESDGTAQSSEGESNNPSAYHFLITTFVLSYRALDNYYATDATDTLDTLDLKVRQLIRNNMGGGTNYDYLQYDPSPSQIKTLVLEGLSYEIESRGLIAHLPSGAKT